MLSIVVVGRNDSHGYNLHKRVASSLNNFAMNMSGNDEIIFVDWNSDDCNPSFVEAIRDTLTPQALKRIKVYRVRKHVHEQLSQGVPRPILEPIARNVGIRRAQNYWVLSTNTDMLFDTNERTFTNILKDLEPHLYHLYRFELPEYIWDSFNRLNPTTTIQVIRSLSQQNSIEYDLSTTPTENFIGTFPDAVGDFQLATRNIWHSLRGFPEDMLKGWHVDSRFSVSFEAKYRVSARTLDRQSLKGYHQNHLRMSTHFHSTPDINPLSLIDTPYANPDAWGLGNMELELMEDFSRIRPSPKRIKYNKTLQNPPILLQKMLKSPQYNLEIVVFFLLDELINLKEGSSVLLSSYSNELEKAIESKILRILESKSKLTLIKSTNLSQKDTFDLVILDFGLPSYLLSHRDPSNILSEFVDRLSFNLEFLLRAPKNQRLVLIAAQHWALRSFIVRTASVPLFNNYSRILSGRTKGVKSRFSRKIFRTLILEIVLNDTIDELKSMNILKDYNYNLFAAKFSFFSLIISIVPRIIRSYYRLPRKIRNFTTPALRRLLRIA